MKTYIKKDTFCGIIYQGKWEPEECLISLKNILPSFTTLEIKEKVKIICRNSFILFFLVSFSAQFSFAQNNNPTKWPYGGKIDVSRKKERTNNSLNFKRHVNFYKAKFDSIANFSYAKFNSIADFRLATFLQNANFYKAKFARIADFELAVFYHDADFYKARFLQDADFYKAGFLQDTDFTYARFNSIANFYEAEFFNYADFTYAKFNSTVKFSVAKFDSIANFREAKFDSIANFRRTTFSKDAIFYKAEFLQYANFNKTKFLQYTNFYKAKFDSANFKDAIFSQVADFSYAKFNKKPLMDNCKFGKILILKDTNFEKGVDFLKAIFDSVETIYVSNQTTFPKGKLGLKWDQFKAKEELRIRLYDPPPVLTSSDSSYIEKLTQEITEIETLVIYDSVEDNKDSLIIQIDSLYALVEKEKTKLESIYDARVKSVKIKHYQQVEAFYNRLRDNFLKQGNEVSANEVMYELRWQRKEIIGGFWWNMYGWFSGWGFKGWLFIIKIVLPIILAFAGLWYTKYYSVLQKIIFKDEIKDAENLAVQDSTYQKIWYSLLFSITVLFSIRIKKEWIFKYKNFMFWVILEWSIGIGLLFLFIYFLGFQIEQVENFRYWLGV